MSVVRIPERQGQRHRTYSWAPRCASKGLMYPADGYATLPSADDFTVEPAIPSERPWHVHWSENAWTPSLHFAVLSIIPKRDQAYWSASESKPSSCMRLIFIAGGRSLHESQLVNQGTAPLRSCRSLPEIVTRLVGSRVSVHRVALMPCPLAQRLQKKEPAS